MSKYNNDIPMIIKQHIFGPISPERLELMKEVEEIYYIRFIKKDGTRQNRDLGTFNNLEDARKCYQKVLTKKVNEYESKTIKTRKKYS